MADSNFWSMHDIVTVNCRADAGSNGNGRVEPRRTIENGACEMKSESASTEPFVVVHHWAPEQVARANPRRSSECRSRAIEAYRTLRLNWRFDAPPQRVFDAWLDPPLAARWLFATASRPIAHVEIDARVGRRFRFVDRDHGDAIEYVGEYTEIVPHRRLAFMLVLPLAHPVVTRVTVAIASLNRGSRLSLIHESVPSVKASYTNDRWAGILYGLGATLAPDADHRVEDPRDT
jgi:uncharacterized protein YndB with AHSA1/START domain